jgi:hypothetical protein
MQTVDALSHPAVHYVAEKAQKSFGLSLDLTEDRRAFFLGKAAVLLPDQERLQYGQAIA